MRRLFGLLACCIALAGVGASASAAPASPAASLARLRGYPVLTVDGRPFFVYGAAFFYERIPREEWTEDLSALRDLGVNTIDLYVVWNWHETADGQFDFDGRTNPRRDLRGLLRTIGELGFKVIVRPGPVIRNEWRNGGYPAWLLERPEYGMPEHDRLEGRYPPTATLQNASSDDAAAEWMHNQTHLTYAKRWLEHALGVVADSHVSVLGVALDDDQGAYINNQTWPAPHLTQYLDWLAVIARQYTTAPAFINTYEMKVTASSSYWAMGDWYQSDTYAIGEHDRSDLAFSTGLLQTQTRGPVMLSEFQAGWLEQPGDVLPRASEPANTWLAMNTLLGMGLHGLVNFPAQDTIYPAGWEAPFANAFYAWDAALEPDRTLQPRAAPTKLMGGLVRVFGEQLAATHVAADAAIAYTTSAYDSAAIDETILDGIVERTRQAQAACRSASLACDLVDLRFADADVLHRYPVLFVPVTGVLGLGRMVPQASDALSAYARGGGLVQVYEGDLTPSGIDRALRRAGHRRNVDRLAGASLLQSDEPGSGAFLVAANYDSQTLAVPKLSVVSGSGRISVGPFLIGARDAVLVSLDIPLRTFAHEFRASDRLVSATCPFDNVSDERGVLSLHVATVALSCVAHFNIAGRSVLAEVDRPPAWIRVDTRGSLRLDTSKPRPVWEKPRPPALPTMPIRDDVRIATLPEAPLGDRAVTAYVADVYRDGYPAVVLENDLVRVVVSPSAGGRAFVFEDLVTKTSAFTTVGALRDAATMEPPISVTDRISKYTHQFTAGTFNRSYMPSISVSDRSASVKLTYAAPDVPPEGETIERTITLLPHERTFTVDERVDFLGDDPQARAQRGVSISSLAVGNPRDMTTQVMLTPGPHDFAPPASASTATIAGPLPVRSGNALGFYDTRTKELATISWRAGDVESADLERRPDSVVARLVFAPNRPTRTRYGYFHAPSVAAAQQLLGATGVAVQGR